MPDITLRYFAMTGRAQPLRAALTDAGIPFEDLRFDMQQWQASREQPPVAGPYRGLPTLTWHGQTLAETLPIATFLSRQLGEYEALTPLQIAQREAITSNCYLEVITRMGELIYADLLYPGSDPRHAFIGFALPRALEKLQALEPQLEHPYLCGQSPGLADFFATEALHVLRYMLGPDRDPALSAKLPNLFTLSHRIASRPNALARPRNAPFTARPDEPKVIQHLSSADLTPHGL